MQVGKTISNTDIFRQNSFTVVDLLSIQYQLTD